MTEQEIKDRVEQIVYVNYNRTDIERKCKEHNIKVTKNRSQMEEQLIKEMVKNEEMRNTDRNV